MCLLSKVANSCPVQITPEVEFKRPHKTRRFLDIVQNIKNDQRYTFSVLKIPYLFVTRFWTISNSYLFCRVTTPWYNLNLKNGAGGLGTIPETMKITVMKPIKKGEPLLRQYGLTWISLVFNACRLNKKQLCYFNKNFKDIRSGPFGRGPMCKPNHMSSAHFASLWNQQERDEDELVLLDRKARKRFKKILKRLYEYILPTLTNNNKVVEFLNEMTNDTRDLVSLIKKWTKRGLIVERSVGNDDL